MSSTEKSFYQKKEFGKTLKRVEAEKTTIVVDIDGIVADCKHRLKHLEGKTKDWDAFFSAVIEDDPIPAIIHLVEALALTRHRIVFCTGRPLQTAADTLEWLDEHVPIFKTQYAHSAPIFMREKGDHRPDVKVKPELLKKAELGPEKVLFIIEDRDQMVKKWRDLGYTVLQPCEGNY